LYGQGKFHKVVIDDRLPVKSNGDVQFAWQSENDAWWLPLLEKGAAKFFGAYDQLDEGNGNEAFQMLTGYPSSYYGHSKWTGSKLLEVLRKSDDAHHVMWSSPKIKYKENDIGIVTSHVYSVLNHISWKGRDFIQLRNPWAEGEFTGKWSDSDKSSLAKAFHADVKHTVTDEGKFWMEFKDYEEIFG